MDNFEENIIIGIFVSLIAEVIFRTIDCIILNKEGLKDFISRLLKQKSKGYTAFSVNHPNTPFTFDENHNFVGH